MDMEDTKIACVHCGDECPDDQFVLDDDHHFCCNGCMMVYTLLQENDMGAYYDYEQMPGISQSSKKTKNYRFLDDKEIVDKLLSFRNDHKAKITLNLPQIHCSSCLWLLEHLHMLNSGVISSRVNFMRKEATILFDENSISLRDLVELLSKIGYEPSLNYDKLDQDRKGITYERRLLYQLGLAGFAFGNVMMLSFPEYLGFHKASTSIYVGYINIALATPVLLYSGVDYLKSAWRGIKHKYSNIDVPVALGMLTLFSRSVYEILSGSGEGYLDSFTGFVFFLLIGKWFQSFTYQALDFNRNYKSYFPISATIKSGKEWITKSIDKIVPGDVLMIKNEELIPTDATVLQGNARVDYSFVTGEADLISKHEGQEVLAGGKQMGNSIIVEAQRSVDQSYLTQLWNEDTFKDREESTSSRLIGVISKYFTYVIIVIALATLGYWLVNDSSKAFNTFTAVLIVACPCALALAIPFTYGNILRILSRNGFYLKNVHTIEDIQDIDTIIFDKTGTITDSASLQMNYEGTPLSNQEKALVKSACSQSSHPLSKAVVQHFDTVNMMDITKYEDHIGQGFIAEANGHQIKLGSSQFIFNTKQKNKKQGVFIEIDGVYKGFFNYRHAYRKGIQEIIAGLQKHFSLSLLSGDSDKEAARIEDLFSVHTDIYFNQKPKDKLDKIKLKQDEGHRVMMIGDGLNDAGALKQSNVGLVISDEVNNFSPACDGMLAADRFNALYRYIKYLKFARYIIYGAFILAFLYNTIGLSFAITGRLSPVIAAILMPLSSISVIVYGVVMSYFSSKFFIKNES